MIPASQWGLILLLGVALLVVLRHLLGLDRGDKEARGSVELYAAATLYEARLVLDLLEEAGIRAVIRNENLTGLTGALPEAATRPTVWLADDADWERARNIVAAYEARRASKLGGEISCPVCSEDNPANYELCWRCQSSLTLLQQTLAGADRDRRG